MRYELPIVEQRVKPHQVTALHMMAALAFVGAGAIMSLLYEPAKIWGTGLWIIGVLLMIVAMGRNKWLVKPANNRILRIIELLILLSLAIFTTLQKWPPPAIMFGVLTIAVGFALWWESQPEAGVQVVLDDAGIKLPVTSRRRFINWQDADQVIIRFGILTIDCEDNRLYQYNIANTQIDKEAFEEYCRVQIAAGKLKKDKNDW
jgi:hypothetical protein